MNKIIFLGLSIIAVSAFAETQPTQPTPTTPPITPNNVEMLGLLAQPTMLHLDYFTLIPAFGDSPNISGAYMASTLVCGSLNSPTLFKRIV